MAEKTRPGVMLYFDMICPVLTRMTDAQAGIFFKAIMGYAKNGVVPDLDPMCGMAFDLLRSSIDRDAERYLDTITKRRYATYCREERKKELEPLSFDDWRDQMMSDDVTCYPILISAPAPTSISDPTAKTNPMPTTTAKTNPMPTTTADGKAMAGGLRGKERENRAPTDPEERRRYFSQMLDTMEGR